jgi:hypothetical protein
MRNSALWMHNGASGSDGCHGCQRHLNAKIRRALLRTGLQAKQLTLNKTSWVPGPVSRVSNFFSIGQV